MWPKHKCGMYLTHNQHRDYYQTVEQALAEGNYYDDSDWVSPEQRARAIETDEVWALQWYPHTPIGSYSMLAADLDVLLQAARDVEKQDG